MSGWSVEVGKHSYSDMPVYSASLPSVEISFDECNGFFDEFRQVSDIVNN